MPWLRRHMRFMTKVIRSCSGNLVASEAAPDISRDMVPSQQLAPPYAIDASGPPVLIPPFHAASAGLSVAVPFLAFQSITDGRTHEYSCLKSGLSLTIAIMDMRVTPGLRFMCQSASSTASAGSPGNAFAHSSAIPAGAVRVLQCV